jgi:beta-lactamase superfamily II metal-dependent hydrolase
MSAPLPRFYILDVGHGNAAVLAEQSATVLVDAAIGSHVLEFLNRKRLTKLSLVVLSHSDKDHIAGLVGLLGAGIQVDTVRLNTDSEKSSELWRDLLFLLEDARRRGKLHFHVGLSTGELPVDGLSECKLEVVSPNPDIAALGPGNLDSSGRKITSNTISTCIRVHYQGSSVALLSGDLDQIALDSIEAAGTDISASLLVFPHHGGLPGSGNAEAFTSQLLSKVKPKTIVFSNGRGLRDNPRPEVVEAARAVGNVYLACTQLSAICSEKLIERDQLRASDLFSAGALRNFCCAGTVEIDVAAQTIIGPQREAHIAFVRESVPKALCR